MVPFRRPFRFVLLAALAGVLVGPLPASGQGPARSQGPRDQVQEIRIGAPAKTPKPKRVVRYAPNVVVVTYKAGDSQPMRRQLETRYGLTVDANAPSRYFVRYFIGAANKGVAPSVEAVAAALAKEPGVRWAEPDYAISPDQIPNDPNFIQLWGLHNTGQNSGTPDADIDAPEAWAMVPAGPDVKVAVLDDGVEYTHPDLAANIWVNPGEIAGNRIDDDRNGYIDDVRGWDTADNDGNPMPATVDDAHGTHVAGTVAAVTNNGIGVAGVGKRIKVIPVRMYEGQSTWLTSLANGVDYARVAGAKVINVSYNTDAYTNFLMDAILRAQAADIVYVGSSGNNGENIDGLRGQMKAIASNIMFVAATDRNDQLADFSNFGQTTDIAAPGDDIWSTVPDSEYASFSGTSMATPHVASAAGLVRAMFPTWTYAQVIARLNAAADYKRAFIGRIAGGRLNLANALETDTVLPGTPAPPICIGRTSGQLRIQTTAVGDNGNTGLASRYEIRVSESPIQAGNYAAARLVAQAPPGPAAGQAMTLEVPHLAPGRPYYYAVRAFDNVGNASVIAVGGPFATGGVPWRDTLELGSQWTGQAGKTWTLTSGNALTGLRAWDDSPNGNYAVNENSTLTLNSPVTVTGPTAFRFLGRVDLEAGYDFLYVETSTDGVTWFRVAQYTGADLRWKAYNAILPGTGTRTLSIRLRLTSDDTVTHSGVVLDDFSLVPMTALVDDNVETGTSGWTAAFPWTISNDRSLSPTRSWTESHKGPSGVNLNAVLSRPVPIDLTGVADPVFTFGLWYRLEFTYDWLTVELEADARSSVPLALTGTSSGWMMHSLAIDGKQSFTPTFRVVTDDSSSEDGINLDDLGVYGEPWRLVHSVNLTLNLDGFTGPAGGRTVLIEMFDSQAGIVSETHRVTLPISGQSVALKTFGDGFTPLTVRADGWLRVRQTMFLAPDINFTVNLVNGDVDGDNAITTSDFVIVNRCFGKSVGQTGYEARADLTGDGKVDAADVAIVTRNQRKRGD